MIFSRTFKCVTAFGLLFSLPSIVTGNDALGFHEDWSKGIQSNRWIAYRKMWGSDNNGCVPELIQWEDDVVDGVTKKVVVITTQGNLTKSKIKGVILEDGEYVNSGKPQKVGACITTTNFYASGVYDIKFKIGLTNDNPPKPPVGLSPFLMIHHYEQHYAGKGNPKGNELNPLDPQYVPRHREIDPPFFYSAVVSEIDFPEFGYQGDFSVGSYNTFISSQEDGGNVQRIPFPHSIMDGKYHTYRLEWRTKLKETNLTDDQVKPRGAYYYVVDAPDSSIQGFPAIKKEDCKWYVYVGASATFYLDGIRVGESTENVSPISGRLAIGAWFPSWAGVPNWDESKIYISDITVKPFFDEGDVLYQPETYPTMGLVPVLQTGCNK